VASGISSLDGLIPADDLLTPETVGVAAPIPGVGVMIGVPALLAVARPVVVVKGSTTPAAISCLLRIKAAATMPNVVLAAPVPHEKTTADCPGVVRISIER
jgi:hypothetical protein